MCKQCAMKNHKNLIKRFLEFCAKHEEAAGQDEARKTFRSRTKRLERRLSQQKKLEISTKYFATTKQTPLDLQKIICAPNLELGKRHMASQHQFFVFVRGSVNSTSSASTHWSFPIMKFGRDEGMHTAGSMLPTTKWLL